MAARPLLFLDVDGVLSPFPDCPEGYREYAFFPENEEPVRLAEIHGTWLRELAAGFDLAWATGWGAEANRILCPHFGLRELPVVTLPPVPFEPRVKVPGVASFAGDRPAAWADDIVTSEARAWAERRRAPTLLVEVDSARGLERSHVDELLGWAAQIAWPASGPTLAPWPGPRARSRSPTTAGRGTTTTSSSASRPGWS
jgi:hypothetical protein